MININERAEGDCGYIALYNEKMVGVYAPSAYSAKSKSQRYFKPPKSRAHMVHVQLVQLPDGSPVGVDPSAL